MKSEFISKENDIAKFTVEYSADEFSGALTDAYKRNRDRFMINGFRKGKAPMKIIESHYGKDVFYEDALNELLKRNYGDAVDELDLKVIDQPKIDVPEIKRGEPVKLTFEVPCFPEMEVKDYRGVEVQKVHREVKDEDIQSELENVQKSQARMDNVDRASEDGDTVVIDFEGSIDGDKFDGGSAENYELKLGSGQFIPGFEDQLVGRNTGEEVEVSVTFPDDYGSKDLAGKDAIFKTRIHEIKTEILPEIDDDLASDVSDFETIDEYKKDIAKKMQEEFDARSTNFMKDAMLDKILENNKFDAPSVMIADETDKIIGEMEQQLRYQGLNLDQYMAYTGKTRGDLRNDVKGDAEKRVKTRILIRNIIRQENITVDDNDVDKEIEEFAKQYGQTVEEFKKVAGENSVRFFREDAETKKAIDTIFEAVNLVDAPEKSEGEKVGDEN